MGRARGADGGVEAEEQAVEREREVDLRGLWRQKEKEEDHRGQGNDFLDREWWDAYRRR